ncbi:MAG: DUF1801 domain-containing protein [Candidatus Hodarchaeota archaeon]
MTELKTRPNDKSVMEFLNKVENTRRREDSFEILKLMSEVTEEEPKMWGDSIIGFGSYHYKYASGREADWLQIGFSPRKQSLTIYIMDGFEKYKELLDKLGKHKTGKSCLYINKLEDVSIPVLKEIMIGSVKHIRKTTHNSD